MHQQIFDYSSLFKAIIVLIGGVLACRTKNKHQNQSQAKRRIFYAIKKQRKKVNQSPVVLLHSLKQPKRIKNNLFFSKKDWSSI